MLVQRSNMRRCRKLFFGCCAVLLAMPLISSNAVSQQVDYYFDASLPAPELPATAWALMEFNSGVMVAGSNVSLPLPPASITKLMTNYVVYNALQQGDVALQDQVLISEKAWRTEGSRMFADVGSRVTLDQLLKSTVIQSGNDAAVALAEHVAGSETKFASAMNRTAAAIGLQHSHFENVSGLPAAGHVMSARDIAVLAAAIIRDHPGFYAWYSQKEYTHNNIVQQNRNKLLWKDSSVDGLKTGYTEAAGFCLVGSAQRGGQRWIAVVLGAADERSREKSVLALLDYAYAAYSPLTLHDQQGGMTTAVVYQGEIDQVLLQAQRPVKVVVPVGREQDVQTEIQMSPYFQAPISIGQAMGVASLTLDGKPLTTVPLLAMSNIKRGSVWKRLWDATRLWAREFFYG